MSFFARAGQLLLAILASATLALSAVAQSPKPPAALIDEFVVANRILADQGIIADGFGHLSVRSPTNPNRFYMSRARAAGLVTR